VKHHLREGGRERERERDGGREGERREGGREGYIKRQDLNS